LKADTYFKIGTVTNSEKLDLGHLSLDIKEYRDIWFKTSLIRSKQAKTELHKRVLKIIKPSFKLYFSCAFYRKNQLFPRSSKTKSRIREKGSNPNEKWQMLCI
jgi:phosphoribosylformylglycinamidine synthase